MSKDKCDLSDLPDTVIRELAPARVRRAAEAARRKDNEMLVDRIKGMPVTQSDEDDPRNPNSHS